MGKHRRGAGVKPRKDYSLNVKEIKELEQQVQNEQTAPSEGENEAKFQEDVEKIKKGEGLSSEDAEKMGVNERTQKGIQTALTAYPNWRFNYFDNERVRVCWGIRSAFFMTTKSIALFPWAAEMMTPPRMLGGDRFMDRRTIKLQYVPGLMVVQIMDATVNVVLDIYGEYVNKINKKELKDDQLQVPAQAKASGAQKCKKLSAATREKIFAGLGKIVEEQGKLLELLQKNRLDTHNAILMEYEGVMQKLGPLRLEDILHGDGGVQNEAQRLDTWERILAPIKTQFCLRFIRCEEIFYRVLLDAYGRLENFARLHDDPYAKRPDTKPELRRNYLQMFDGALDITHHALLTWRTTGVDFLTNDFRIPVYSELDDTEKKLFKLNKDECQTHRNKYNEILAKMKEMELNKPQKETIAAAA